jgi:hypothetical protein
MPSEPITNSRETTRDKRSAVWTGTRLINHILGLHALKTYQINERGKAMTGKGKFSNKK